VTNLEKESALGRDVRQPRVVDLNDDGLIAVVRDPEGSELLLEWDGGRWVCPCGHEEVSKSPCAHAGAVGRRLPLAVAQRLASRGGGSARHHDAFFTGETAEAKAGRARRLAERAERLRRGDRLRTERLQAEDAQRPDTSTVTVRYKPAREPEPTRASQAKPAADLSGQRYGRLVAVERGADYVSPRGQVAARWRVRCDCGNERLVRSSHLTGGNTKSCGCVRQRRRPQ